jgi:hypothetical protein
VSGFLGTRLSGEDTVSALLSNSATGQRGTPKISAVTPVIHPDGLMGAIT